MEGVTVVFILFGLPILSLLVLYVSWNHFRLRAQELEVRALEARVRMKEAELRSPIPRSVAAPSFSGRPTLWEVPKDPT
jgi:hypothetical protein